MKFARALLIGFFVAATAGVFLSRSHRATGKPDETTPLADLIHQLPASRFDLSLRTPAATKPAHAFWSYPNSQHWNGVALRPFEDPALFGSLFPGYPRTITKDDALWRKYFSRNFDFDIYSDVLNGRSSNAFRVAMSWIGSLDIYSRYGADVIVFGASDTYRGIVPGELYRKLDRKGSILFSTAGALKPITLGKTVEVLKSAIERGDVNRSRLAIYGYSYHVAFTRSDSSREQDAIHRSELDAIASPRDSRRLSRWHAKLSDFLPEMTWADLLKPNRAEITDSSSEVGSQRRRVQSALIPGVVSPMTPEGLYYFRRPEPYTEEAVEKLASSVKPFYGRYAGFEPRDCDLAQAKREFAETLEHLKEIAGRVLVYVPPASPIQIGAAPPCLLAGVRDMLREFASDRVLIHVEPAESFGLEWRDFTTPAETPGVMELDGIHMNYEGARRVTSRIADWVNASDRRTSR